MVHMQRAYERFQADDLPLRRANDTDAPAVADLYIETFRATYRFALAHDEVQVRDWVRDSLIPHYETWVATDPAGQVVGLLALDDLSLEQLYVLPAWQGCGLGSRLLEHAKQCRPGGLVLHAFQENHRARQFYEQRGFKLFSVSDGRDNDERQPDACYTWLP